MSSTEAKLKAQRFLKEFGCGKIDYDFLKKVVEQQGYTVVEYNHIFNDEDVETLIEALKLSDSIIRSRGFTYADQNHRIVFVHEDLSPAEKLLVLAHEEGHIFCGHMRDGPIIGKDVQEEFEANEFAHFILNPGKAIKVKNKVKENKKAVIIGAICIVLLIAGCTALAIVNQEKKYYGEYYITESGDKYHEKGCIFVKDKNNCHRMTVEEFESGEYEPCGICLP